MLYKAIYAISITIYAFLCSSTRGSEYYVKSDPSSSYGCADGDTTCHIYCDEPDHDNINAYRCGNAVHCHFHCDEKRCGASATLYGDDAANLYVTQDSAGQECFKDATIYTPNNGSAYFTTMSLKGFQAMTVKSGSHSKEITIECSSPQQKQDDCAEMNVDAATAEYLHITIGNEMEFTSAIVQCPVNSKYSSSNTAPCVIDATDGVMQDILIIAPDGIPKGVYVDDCLSCDATVRIQCHNIDTINPLSTYPFSKDSECWWTSAPTIDPTIYPTLVPTISPTKSTASPTHHPSTKQTLNPSVTTVDPTSTPTQMHLPSSTYTESISPSETPTIAPTRAPSVDPTHSPTKQPSASPTANPISQPTENPSVAPTQSTSQSPSRLPSYSPSSIPSKTTSVTPTYLPSKSPSNTRTDASDTISTELMDHEPAFHKSHNKTSDISVAIIGSIGVCCIILVYCLWKKSKHKDIEIIRLSTVRWRFSAFSQPQPPTNDNTKLDMVPTNSKFETKLSNIVEDDEVDFDENNVPMQSSMGNDQFSNAETTPDVSDVPVIKNHTSRVSYITVTNEYNEELTLCTMEAQVGSYNHPLRIPHGISSESDIAMLDIVGASEEIAIMDTDVEEHKMGNSDDEAPQPLMIKVIPENDEEDGKGTVLRTVL